MRSRCRHTRRPCITVPSQCTMLDSHNTTWASHPRWSSNCAATHVPSRTHLHRVAVLVLVHQQVRVGLLHLAQHTRLRLEQVARQTEHVVKVNQPLLEQGRLVAGGSGMGERGCRACGCTAAFVPVKPTRHLLHLTSGRRVPCAVPHMQCVRMVNWWSTRSIPGRPSSRPPVEPSTASSSTASCSSASSFCTRRRVCNARCMYAQQGM